MNRQLSRDDIGNQGRVLLNDFIVDRMKGDHVQSDLRQEELLEPGTPSGMVNLFFCTNVVVFCCFC